MVSKPDEIGEKKKFLPGRIKVVDRKFGDRIRWANKLDFMLTCIGYAVGYGNIWRFPYLCYLYGGGAFLVPYFIMMITLGLPSYFLLFVFGQFSKLGLLQMWRISPIFKGVGYAVYWINFITSCGYGIISAQVAVYFFTSLSALFYGIPWDSCNNTWNTPNCSEIGWKNSTSQTIIRNLNGSSTAVQEYYNNYILQKSDGLESFSHLSWKLSLGLVFRYLFGFILLINGIKSLGKSAYFFSIFPYFLLVALLIRSCTLPGFLDGIFYFLRPDFSQLLDIKVWYIAASQVIFSIGAVDPTNIVMASYNDYHHDCLRDALVITVINSLTSLLAGFVVFSTLGFIAYERQTLVMNVATNGPGLVFEVYPEAISRMPQPALWAVLFFLMMLSLGISSYLPALEALSSSLTDLWPSISKSFLRRAVFKFSLFTLLCVGSLPMASGAGIYLLAIFDHYSTTLPNFLLGFCIIIVIIYFYGYENVEKNYELMLGKKPALFWKISWKYTAPLTLIIVFILISINFDSIKVDNYTFPKWSIGLGWSFAIIPISIVLFYFLIYYCYNGGFFLLKLLLLPSKKYRSYWDMYEKQEDEDKNQEYEFSKGVIIEKDGKQFIKMSVRDPRRYL